MRTDPLEGGVHSDVVDRLRRCTCLRLRFGGLLRVDPFLDFGIAEELQQLLNFLRWFGGLRLRLRRYAYEGNEDQCDKRRSDLPHRPPGHGFYLIALRYLAINERASSAGMQIRRTECQR